MSYSGQCVKYYMMFMCNADYVNLDHFSTSYEVTIYSFVITKIWGRHTLRLLKYPVLLKLFFSNLLSIGGTYSCGFHCGILMVIFYSAYFCYIYWLNSSVKNSFFFFFVSSFFHSFVLFSLFFHSLILLIYYEY